MQPLRSCRRRRPRAERAILSARHDLAVMLMGEPVACVVKIKFAIRLVHKVSDPSSALQVSKIEPFRVCPRRTHDPRTRPGTPDGRGEKETSKPPLSVFVKTSGGHAFLFHFTHLQLCKFFFINNIALLDIIKTPYIY